MTDGELREQLIKYCEDIGVYNASEDWGSKEAFDEFYDGLLRLIKQNTPSKESVVPTDTHTSKADDSSIPDDTSLQSQPQPGQEWQDELTTEYVLPNGNTLTVPLDDEAKAALRLWAQRQVLAEWEGIDRNYYTNNTRLFTYADNRIAALTQQLNDVTEEEEE